MRIGLARPLFAGLAMAAALVGSAEARNGAPIVYAGQAAPQQTAELSLAGGDERSYGYGRAREQAGAVIDLRRPGANEAPAPQRREVAAQPRGQGAATAPEWLERERVGPPYQANGQWYVPTAEPGYSVTGTASWYGPQFHGQATASGEPFDQEAITAAHPTLPIPSLVQVTNLENGREIIVRVNDRGPFVGDRVIDLSHRAAEVLGFDQSGTARVHVRYLGPAPRHYAVNGSEQRTPAPLPQATPLVPTPAPALAFTPAASGPVSLLPPAAQAPISETELEGAPLAPARTQAASWTPPQAQAAAPLDGGYVVQVGAYSDLMNAQRVRSAVGAAGPATVDSRSTSSGELFRVRVGPFATREEADAARRSVAGLGYGDAIVAR